MRASKSCSDDQAGSPARPASRCPPSGPRGWWQLCSHRRYLRPASREPHATRPLSVHEPGVRAVLVRKQLAVRTRLKNETVAREINAIDILDRAKTMGNRDRRESCVRKTSGYYCQYTLFSLCLAYSELY